MLIVAVMALFAAIKIPRKIMLNQQFASLTEQYRSTEMGFAIYSLFRFFEKDCQSKPDKIREKYIKRFKKEIEKPLAMGKKIDPSKTLQFQRRLVAYFYWDLSRLYFESRCPSLKKKQLAQMIEANERKLISLVLQMSEANKECLVNNDDIGEPPDDDVPMNQFLKRLYEESWDIGIMQFPKQCYHINIDISISSDGVNYTKSYGSIMSKKTLYIKYEISATASWFLSGFYEEYEIRAEIKKTKLKQPEIKVTLYDSNVDCKIIPNTKAKNPKKNIIVLKCEYKPGDTYPSCIFKLMLLGKSSSEKYYSQKYYRKIELDYSKPYLIKKCMATENALYERKPKEITP